METETIQKYNKAWYEANKKVLGSFNDAPPNFRKITQKEMAQSIFLSYSPEYVEYRQIILKDKGYIPITLYWFHNGKCIGISSDYWKGKMLYYKAHLCEHEWEIKNLGRCYNRYTCLKCGFSEDIDSSD